LNEAPFHVVESGYGGFLLPVDIYLRTRCEPRRLRFLYDLQLDSSCSVACVRFEKVVFWNPAEPLRSALRQSGAVSDPRFHTLRSNFPLQVTIFNLIYVYIICYFRVFNTLLIDRCGTFMGEETPSNNGVSLKQSGLRIVLFKVIRNDTIR